MNRKRNALGNVLIVLGVLAVFVGGGIYVAVTIREQNAEKSAEVVVRQLENRQTEPDEQPQDADDFEEEEATTRIDGLDYLGYIRLCRFDISLPVIAEWDFDYLKIAPTRYRGRLRDGNMVIAAHNYRTHFNALRYSDPGDEIIFTDVAGTAYHYEIKEIEQLKPTDIEKMTTGDWDLTLFTCTPGGAARVAARCELTRVEPAAD